MPIDDALNELKKSEQNKAPEPEQILLDDYLKKTNLQKADLDKLESYTLKDSDLETLVDANILPSFVAKKYLSTQDELILGLKARVKPDKFKTMFNSGCRLMAYTAAIVPLSFMGIIASSIVFLKYYGDIPDTPGVRLLLSGTGIAAGLAVTGALVFSHTYRSERKGKKLLQEALDINVDDAHIRYINALASMKEANSAKISVPQGNQKVIDAALKLKENIEALDRYYTKMRELE